MRALLAFSFVTILGACSQASKSTGGDILIIGDSVMAWNKVDGQDVGSAISSELDRAVVNRAMLGAQVRAGGLAPVVGLSIPDQLRAGPWNWVIMNGGANDLGISCDCVLCDAEIDALISEDGSVGDIPTLIERAQARGAQVVWLGYYKAPDTRAFQGCRPGLVEVERRIAVYAEASDGVFFLDAEDVFDLSDRGLFDLDRTHPSARGSAVMGRYIAETIAGNS